MLTTDIQKIWPHLTEFEKKEILSCVSALEKLKEKEQAYLAVISLKEFVKQAWHVLEPHTIFVNNWHIDAICDHLEAVSKGQIAKVVFNVPPGSSKPVSIYSNLIEKTHGRIELKDVVVGDEVLTHMGRFRRVSAVHEQGILPLLEITTHCGRSLKVAYDHPLLTPTGWKQAQDITTNDVLGEIHAQEAHGTKTLSNEEARLLGYLIGDGSVKYLSPSFTNADPETLADFQHCARVCGFTTRIKRLPPSRLNKNPKASLVGLLPICPPGRSIWHAKLGESPVTSFLKKHGLRGKCSYDKRVPAAVMAGNSEVIANYLGAYWACDGSIGKKATKWTRRDRTTEQFRKDIRCNACTVSKGLAFDHQHLLSRLGIRSRVRTRTAQLKTRVQGDLYVYHMVEIINQDQIAKFGSVVPIYHTKIKNLIDYNRTEFSRIINADSVVEIKKIDDGECRCLTVEEDASFTIEDIAVHNSLLACVFWPAWEWIQKPHLRWLFASYASHLSIRDSIKTRILIGSDWYQRNFGDKYRLVKTNEQLITNDKFGFRYATSVGGVGTGERIQRVVNDDLLNATDAHSDAMREQAIKHMRAMSTRGVPSEHFGQVLIMQRLHEMDPTGWVMEQGGWEKVILPAEFDPSRRAHTCIGFSDPRKEEGELLWPALFDTHKLIELKKALGPYDSAAQLQQLPAPADGGIIKEHWFRYYTTLPRVLYVIQSWDTAFKTKQENDFSVCTTWAVCEDGGYYLIDRFKQKIEFPELKKSMISLWRRHKAITILVEDKASGQSLIQEMSRTLTDDSVTPKVFFKMPVKAIKVDTDKVTRVHSCTTTFENNVYLPEGADWLPDYIKNLLVFPNGAHDDDVDSTSQALNYLTARSRGRPPKETDLAIMGR